ncbi:MAG: sugar ABC transporter permease [Chloroflexi bacterium]|nr:MAG: sugar ABC transporter permease [Chloroflexota bacterium]TMG51201.1 MAG: sugar ABC transporter permease [Chloroflexota bacterium]
MPNVTEARPAPLHRAGAGRFTRQERLAYTMLVPILGSIFLIVTYPFVLAVIQSLQATNGGAFVGLQNYVTGLENPLLYEALAATAVYAALVLPTEILLGLGLALAVHRGIKSTALRALFFGMAIVPLVIPPIAVGVIARLMYAPSYGAINHILMLTGITHDEINWLGQPITAMPAVASVDVWQWTPFVYLVLFSGFLTVPRDEIEAAQVDGASGWSQFWRIELYYLRPLLILIVFFRLADVLRVFDHVFILTGGGPGNTTQLLSLYLYRVEFKFSDYGQAAALAVVVLIAISVVYSLVTRVLPLERR